MAGPSVFVQLLGTQDLRVSGRRPEHLTFPAGKHVFQGPNVPPSNAVDFSHDLMIDGLPRHFYFAKPGETTFPFSIQLPAWLPASVDFQNGTAEISYELRAVAGMYSRSEDERQDLVQSQSIGVLEPWGRDIKQESKWTQESGLYLAVTAPRQLVATQKTDVTVKVQNRSKQTITSIAVAINHDLSSEHVSKLHSEIHEQRFEGAEYSVHPGNEATAVVHVRVPDFSWGSNGFVGKDGASLFRVDTRMTVFIRGATSILVLAIPVTIGHPAAEISPPPRSPMRYPPVLQGSPYGPGPKPQTSRRQVRPVGGPAGTAPRRIPPTATSPAAAPRLPRPAPLRRRSSQQDVFSKPLPNIVSPTPVRSRSGSFDVSRPVSEDVRLLEDIVAREGYTPPVVLPPRSPHTPRTPQHPPEGDYEEKQRARELSSMWQGPAAWVPRPLQLSPLSQHKAARVETSRVGTSSNIRNGAGAHFIRIPSLPASDAPASAVDDSDSEGDTVLWNGPMHRIGARRANGDATNSGHRR
ncbi:hypothetical protein CALCODRAFT_520001 [Calocera cornea HHB12733]|uniref:Arrestin C-terminal-like domain-containing protein n=1 Tax=Calocera cornea HHB12733 TaxID=1353952 RepID=A0A165DT87_9BASI|nr:hypothetical protein CALCODRAFT_520001 [Calocera cornea HHB12733]